MSLNAADYAGRRRESTWERKLAQDVRLLSEPDRLHFVAAMLDVNEVVALDIARRCLKSRISFEAILELGLKRADANSVQYWLNAVLDALGERRLYRLLDSHRRMYPLAVERACYWLPGLRKYGLRIATMLGNDSEA